MSEGRAHPWRERRNPLRLERRVEFEDYEALRDFLDRVADLSEETGIYPNQSFGRTYVNFTLNVEDGAEQIDEAQRAYVARVDALLERPEA
jgi:pterin-4a-carbinolamine dehydratase